MMINTQKTNRKISLKWQWATLLSVTIFSVYLIVSISFLNVLRQQSEMSERDRILGYTAQVTSGLERIDLPLSMQVVNDVLLSEDSQSAFRLNSYDLGLRIVDYNGHLIYERNPQITASVGVSSAKQGTLEILNSSERLLWVIHQPIVSNTGDYLGNVQYVFDMREYTMYLQQMTNSFIFMSIMALLLCIVMGILLAYYFFSPIQHMNEIMADIKEDSLTHKRLQLSKRFNDELTDLSAGFNGLLDKMDRYVNLQKQFVEDVSHELRTPVAIVEGHLKLLNRWGKNDPKVLEDSLATSLLEIERMKSLIQEMLDLSRAEQAGISYNHELTEVVGVVQQVHQNFQLLYPDFLFQVDKDLDIIDREVWVRMSRNHLEQVLIILLDNAVKYSTDVPQVHITLANTQNKVQIIVQDFGEGIEKEDLPKIFGRFYRVDKARSRQKGGNGLGLSIAKELIEGYNGSLQAESVVRQGSIFKIELPLVDDIETIARQKRKEKEKNILDRS